MDDNPWGAPSPPTLLPTPPSLAPFSTPPDAPALALPSALIPEAPTLEERTVENGGHGQEPDNADGGDGEGDEWEVDSDTEHVREALQTEVHRVKEAVVKAEGEGEAGDLVDATSMPALTVAVPPPIPFGSPVKEAYEEPPMDDFDEMPMSNPGAADPFTNASSTLPPPTTTTTTMASTFDSFADFGGGENEDDDEFGEFGDFDDGDGDESGFGGAPAPPPPPPLSSSSGFANERAAAFASTSSAGFLPPLKLDLSNNPDKASISLQLEQFFNSAYPLASQYLSEVQERQVDGIGQVLVNESLRTMMVSLSSLPELRPLDWRRSRIRREHLIALGVPVNLDDSASSQPLASLILPSTTSFTRTHSPSSAPSSFSSASLPFSTRHHQRATSPLPPPVIDLKRAEELLKLDEDQLKLLAGERLKAVKFELERLSIDASGVLTHTLMRREKEAGDAVTYHGMIQDLVAAAAKMKTSSSSRNGRGSVSRSSSGIWGRN